MSRRLRVPVVLLAVMVLAGNAPAAEARPRAHPVFVDDLSLHPADLQVALNDHVVWLYTGAAPREIVEPRFGLFRTPFPMLPGGSHRWIAGVAATIDYEVRLFPADPLPQRGTIAVPVNIHGVNTSLTRFHARWADREVELPDGVTFDVQYGVERGKGYRWRTWRRATGARSGWLPIACNGVTRTVRTRLRAPYGAVSGWSPIRFGIGCIV